MAHARIDYHMDFISLLSLSNIGVVDPEVMMIKKQQPQVASEHSQEPCGGQEHHRCELNGLPVENIRGVKREREGGLGLAVLEQEQLYQDLTKVCSFVG